MLARISEIIFPIFAIVAAGYTYSRFRRPDLSFVNRLNMDLLVPALLFGVLSSKDFSIRDYGSLTLGALAIVLGSGVLAAPVARFAGVPFKTFVPPMMFTNAGNMGLPLAVFAFGEQALPAAVLLLIVETGLHFTLGTWLMDHRAHFLEVLKKPIVLATLGGLAVNLLDWAPPRAIAVAVDMLGQASIPLLLFSLGVRLIDVNLRDWKIGLLGAALCPVTGVLMYLIATPFLDLPTMQASQLLLFSVLPPAVLNYLVAEQYRQEPGRVASIVMLGNLASFITIPIALVFALR